jgi:hypothetical protein
MCEASRTADASIGGRMCRRVQPSMETARGAEAEAGDGNGRRDGSSSRRKSRRSEIAQDGVRGGGRGEWWRSP